MRRIARRCLVLVNSQSEADAGLVLAQLRELVDLVRTRYYVIERQSSVGAAALRVLSEVARHPGSSPTEIANRLHLHRATTSNLLRALFDRGLARREAAVDDGRSVCIFPTAGGTRLLERSGAGRQGLLGGAIAKLSSTEVARLRPALRPLLGALRQLAQE